MPKVALGKPALSTPASFKRHFNGGVKLEVFESEIAGKGLRTLERLNAGQLLGFYGGPTFASLEAWEQSGRTDPRYLLGIGNGSFIDGKHSRLGKVNHSCDPNVTMLPAVLGDEATVAFLTKRPVEAGEELLLDYLITANGDVDLSQWVCRCGAPTCRGWMYHPDELAAARARPAASNDEAASEVANDAAPDGPASNYVADDQVVPEVDVLEGDIVYWRDSLWMTKVKRGVTVPLLPIVDGRPVASFEVMQRVDLREEEVVHSGFNFYGYGGLERGLPDPGARQAFAFRDRCGSSP